MYDNNKIRDFQEIIFVRQKRKWRIGKEFGENLGSIFVRQKEKRKIINF